MNYELRPASPDDRAFLLQLFSENRADAFAAAGLDESQLRSLLQMQFNAQSQQYARDFPCHQQHIIEQNSQPVGQLITNETDTALRIVDIAILPEFQNQGLGSQVLKNLISSAADQDKSVHLSVESANPARRLYSRLGFRERASNGIYVEMELSTSAI